jgi:hypothetical protein
MKVQPREIDIVLLPAVELMFKRDIDSDMSHDNLTKKFSRVLPRAIRKWSSDAVEELEQFARDQLGLSPLSTPSRIPSVIFRCRTCSRQGPCGKRLTFDEALFHHHLYDLKHKGLQRGGTREMSSYDQFLTELTHSSRTRDIKVLRVDVTISRKVENLIRRMGQNPDRVTYNELRHSTIKVLCSLCPPQVASMDFEHAVRRSVSARFFLYC